MGIRDWLFGKKYVHINWVVKRIVEKGDFKFAYEGLMSDNVSHRVNIIAATVTRLLQRGDTKAIKPLLFALKDKEATLRASAIVSLGDACNAYPHLKRFVIKRKVVELLKEISEKDADLIVREKAKQVLEEIFQLKETSKFSRENTQQDNLTQAQQYFERGAEYVKQQKWAQAIEILKEAVRLDPKHAKAHMALCMAYGGALNLDLARHHFEILKQLDPKLADQLASTPSGMLILRKGNIIEI